MDAAEIALRVEASRLFEHAVGSSLTFRLRLPTDLDFRIAASRAIGPDGEVNFATATHHVLTAALKGWEGPLVRDLLPDVAQAEGNLPLPFDPATVGAYLATHLDVEDALIAEIHRRRDERESARKNSQSASPGS